MWVEMQKPDGKRLLLNLLLTFYFEEQANGFTNAVSINGNAAPTGIVYDTVKADVTSEESWWVEIKQADGRRMLLNLEQCFALDEHVSGLSLAVSIQGGGAPTGATYDKVKQDIMQEQG